MYTSSASASQSVENIKEIKSTLQKVNHEETKAKEAKHLETFGKDNKFLPWPGECPPHIHDNDIINLFKGEGKQLVDDTLKSIEKGDKYETALAMKKFHGELNSLSTPALKEARKHLLDRLEEKHDEKMGKIMRAMFDAVEHELADRKGINSISFPRHPEPTPFPFPKEPCPFPTPPTFPMPLPHELPQKDIANIKKYLY